MARKTKEGQKAYYQENRDRILEYHRIYRENNKEKVKEANKKCYVKNGRKYRLKHRAKALIYRAAYIGRKTRS